MNKTKGSSYLLWPDLFKIWCPDPLLDCIQTGPNHLFLPLYMLAIHKTLITSVFPGSLWVAC